MSRLTVALLWLLAPAATAGAQEPGHPLEAASRRYREVHAMCADFEQVVEVRLLRRTIESTGQVCQQRPNLFSMRFTDPQGDMVVSDGQYFWVYYPSVNEGQVMRYPVAESPGREDFFREFLEDPGAKYEAELGGVESMGGRDCQVVTLTPRAEAAYRRARLWIDSRTHVIRRLELHEANKVRTLTLRQPGSVPFAGPGALHLQRARGRASRGPASLRRRGAPMRLRTRDLPVFPVAAGPVRPGVDPGVRAVDPRSFEIGPETGPRLGLVTLGCDKNTVDSEHMMAALVSAGARVTSDVENADVVVVNTCGFIDAAKEQSIDTILNACALKERGQVKAVVAVGCMVQRYRDELAREIPEVDLFLGIAEMSRLIPELRARGLVEDDFVPNMERPLRILAAETPHVSFLKVSEGCDHTCAFCAIPHMRGLHRSADPQGLVAEARALGEQGFGSST